MRDTYTYRENDRYCRLSYERFAGGYTVMYGTAPAFDGKAVQYTPLVEIGAVERAADGTWVAVAPDGSSIPGYKTRAEAARNLVHWQEAQTHA